MGFFDGFRKTGAKKGTQTKTRAKKILVTHYNLFIGQFLKSSVEKAGYNVIGGTQNGREAIKLFASEQPDLVVLDIQLDEINGLDVCKTMKTINPDIPIIMCSSMRQETMVIEAIKSGACDFVLPPASPDNLNRLIDSIKKHIG